MANKIKPYESIVKIKYLKYAKFFDRMFMEYLEVINSKKERGQLPSQPLNSRNKGNKKFRLFIGCATKKQLGFFSCKKLYSTICNQEASSLFLPIVPLFILSIIWLAAWPNRSYLRMRQGSIPGVQALSLKLPFRRA